MVSNNIFVLEMNKLSRNLCITGKLANSGNEVRKSAFMRRDYQPDMKA